MSTAEDIKARRAARRLAERSKTEPGTQHVLVRTKRMLNDQGISQTTVSIVTKDAFDFTDYRFFRISEASHVEPVEEWVHKDELELYQRSIG